MTNRLDIAKAYGEYEKTKDWGKVKAGLIYTCNGGWIDLGHAQPANSRLSIGAVNLWKQMEAEAGTAPKWECDPANYAGASMAAANYGMPVMPPLQCIWDSAHRFPDGSEGFVVRYRQDHGALYHGLGKSLGVEGVYVVKKGLLQKRKKAIALSIFMAVSRRFETFQSWFSFATDSGFSQDDLVSNLVGFYIGIGEMTRAEAIALLHPVSREAAEAIWDRSGPVGQNKNRSWTPQLQPSWVSDPAARECRDECAAQPKELPAEFRAIKPAEPGVDFFLARV